MAKQEALDKAYMECAYAMSRLSHATRRKVGAIMVSPNGGIIAEGVNGTPSGFDNRCECIVPECHHKNLLEDTVNRTVRCIDCQEVYDSRFIDSFRKPPATGKLITKPECLHAESNAITKVARSTNSSQGATLYVTLSPCFDCAKLIIQSGVTRVVYSERYPYPGRTGPEVKLDGIKLLEEAGIRVDEFPLQCHYVGDDARNLQDEGVGYDNHKPWTNFKP